MRLALVYHQCVGVGGLERYLLEFARRLTQRGHDVILVTACTDGAAEALGIPIHRIDLTGVPKWRLQEVFAERAAALSLPVDYTLGFGRTWKQDVHRAGGGCHARYSALLPWWKRWGRKNRLELRLERRLYTGGHTRRFVVNATPIARQLQDTYHVPPERITVIHTPVDTSRFHPPATPLSSRSRPVFLFVSSHHRRKGLPTLQQALAAVPEAELWIAGRPLKPAHRWQLRRLGISHRVRELGHVDDLAPVYREADWFVHPTLYDACANTVLQALASGLPGIISAADGAHEFIRHGENGWVLQRPTDMAELAGLMRHALRLSAEARQRLSAVARATALPLTWEAHLSRWEDVLQELRASRDY